MSRLATRTAFDPKARRAEGAPPLVGVLPGEGVGPEVVDAAVHVLERVAADAGVVLELRRGPAAAAGNLPGPVAAFCDAVFADGGALLCGAHGGRFVYDLRARFDLFCKLVPLRPSRALADVAIVRPERLRGVDILLVRENVGGVYFGESTRRNGLAEHRFSYSIEQVTRILAVAAELASRRAGRLAVVVKTGGTPVMSDLWCEAAEAARAPGLAVDVLEADNAGYQLVADPERFDVVVAPNLLGDVLADAATVLLASRGMSYSGNFGPDGRAAYQTGHGAARDLAGSGRANPVAQILSATMMLRESFGLEALAVRIEGAIDRVLASGVRTPDIAGTASRIVGTREMAERIAEAARVG